MIRDERLARITEYIQNRHFASVDELMNVLGVSKATIRRDLTVLNEAGAITLTRGGAVCNEEDRVPEPAYNEKRSTNAIEKIRLGEAASKLIKNDQAIILDAGTSTRAMVPFMKDLTGINLVTNDIAIAADLTSYPGINVTVTGGQLRPDFFTLRGYGAEEQIRNMRADIAFIGFDAIDINSGCYITNIDEVALKKRIISVADRVVALCDHTKFHSTAFVLVCQMSEIHVVVTDQEVDPLIVEALKQQDIEVIIA